MKDSKAWWIGVCLLLILLVLIGGTYGLLTGRLPFARDNLAHNRPETAVEKAKAKVRVGDSRDRALSSLSDAWFHSECRLTVTGPIDDLFFYGPNDPNEVQVVLVQSQEDSGVFTVTFVGMIENYMLHLYDHCIPLPTSAFTDS